MFMMDATLAVVSAGLSAGVIALATALGISRIGISAIEGIARQPEASNKIQTAMVVTAALIEGVALFGVLICLLIAMK